MLDFTKGLIAAVIALVILRLGIEVLFSVSGI